ncbi:MAG: hypothetical protein CBC29_06245 [Methylococcaceae bacterium TMED69]|nr:MAG: hypothetical protein CBC29_06245 [Methylococcaceae bacterium TMED69]|tara:strand:- start:1204 stop:1392 length:189 start_codon:yes stop_codon:yes gene_type:complete
MKVYRDTGSVHGVPDYYSIYEKWFSHYMRTGSNESKVLAFHYARVAEEMGQALIVEDITDEF